MDIKEFDNAIADYNVALELKSEDSELYCKRSNAYTSKKDYTQAIEEYDRTIEINPDYDEFYSNRGLAFYRIGEYEQALTDFNELPEWDECSLFYYKAEVLAALGRRQEAQALFNIVVHISMPGGIWGIRSKQKLRELRAKANNLLLTDEACRK